MGRSPKQEIEVGSLVSSPTLGVWGSVVGRIGTAGGARTGIWWEVKCNNCGHVSPFNTARINARITHCQAYCRSDGKRVRTGRHASYYLTARDPVLGVLVQDTITGWAKRHAEYAKADPQSGKRVRSASAIRQALALHNAGDPRYPTHEEVVHGYRRAQAQKRVAIPRDPIERRQHVHTTLLDQLTEAIRAPVQKVLSDFGAMVGGAVAEDVSEEILIDHPDLHVLDWSPDRGPSLRDLAKDRGLGVIMELLLFYLMGETVDFEKSFPSDFRPETEEEIEAEWARLDNA